MPGRRRIPPGVEAPREKEGEEEDREEHELGEQTVCSEEEKTGDAGRGG